MIGPSTHSYPKSARLRAAPEFQAVFQGGLKHSGVFFRLHFLPDSAGRPRLGMAVPKKAVPLSVARNRIKRVSRESFRLAAALPAGDYVLVAQRRAATADNSQLRAELIRLFGAAALPVGV